MFIMADELSKILRVVEKHPSSRISKLIRSVQEQPNQRNVVLLLIELAEHSEFAVDFDISLSYYLNLFEQLDMQQVLVLNDAGILLVNSSKIYARRVDYVHDLVERQILTLSDKDASEAKMLNGVLCKEDGKSCNLSSESVARKSRKRPLEISSDPFEIELTPKKIRKLCVEKRFCQPKQVMEANTVICLDTGQYLHPESWLNGSIFDLENADEVDSKRNYKLFTYHIEHRYNTLVPDINFRLFFEVKDFVGEEGEAAHFKHPRHALLSEEYLREYIKLENLILKQPNTAQCQDSNDDADADADYTQVSVKPNDYCSTSSLPEENSLDTTINLRTEQNITEDVVSLLGEDTTRLSESILQESRMETSGDTNQSVSSNLSNELSATASANSLSEDRLGDTVASSTLNQTTELELPSFNSKAFASSTLCHDEPSLGESAVLTTNGREDNELRVHLPHLDDEGVYVSDLHNIDQNVLSPKVVVTDVMPCLPDKDKITIIVDDEVNEIFNIREELAKFRPLPVAPINLNILQLPDKCLRKRILFKLGTDMDLYLKARCGKRMRLTESSNMASSRRGMGNAFLKITSPPEIIGMNWDNSLPDSDFFGFSEDDDDGGYDDHQDFLGEQSHNGSTLRLIQDDDVNLFLNDMIDRVAKALDNENEELSNRSIVENSQHHDDKNKDLIDENSCCEGTSSFLLNVNTTSDEENQMMCKDNENETSVLCLEQEQKNSNAIDTSVACHGDDKAQELSDSTDFEMQARKTKIQEWHDNLRPILLKSRERHHFDVFQLGSEIIETIQSKSTPIQRDNDIDNDVGTSSTATFMDIMRDKDKSYASRYFLSSLLLANENNIEFKFHKQNSEQPTSWCDVNMKLINSKRHTVSIEDNISANAASDERDRNKIFQKSSLQTKGVLDNSNEVRHSQKRSMSRKKLNCAKRRLILESETDDHTSPTSNTNETNAQSSRIENTALRDKQPSQTTVVTAICSTPFAKQKIDEEIGSGESENRCNAKAVNFRDSNIRPFIAKTSISTDVSNPKNFFPMTGFSPPTASDVINIDRDEIIPCNGTISKQSLDGPTTSHQAKTNGRNPLCYFVEPNITVRSMQALLNAKKVKLKLVQPLKKIEKAHRRSDDLDSGIFSNDDLPLNS